MSNESEAQKANERLLVKALEGLRDSQFLGWTAMMFQEQGGALSDYCAKRLDLIALYVDSMSEDA
jgi:hypothetical protein